MRLPSCKHASVATVFRFSMMRIGGDADPADNTKETRITTHGSMTKPEASSPIGPGGSSTMTAHESASVLHRAIRRVSPKCAFVSGVKPINTTENER